jgi:hypothetical protein
MKIILGTLLATTLLLGGCDENSDQVQRRQQETTTLQAANTVGMPAITNFAEKRMMKQLLELRDQNIPTFTYLVGMNGQVGQKLCDSVGFGLSGATQYTNPQRTTEAAGIVLPQADPNGLFSPAVTDATWVMCEDPTTHKAVPLYVEPRVIISPFALSNN